MDQIALVETQINDGEKLIERLAQEGFDPKAAFWLKTADRDRWYLYIVTPLVDEEGAIQAYKRLHRPIREMPEPFRINPFHVTLVGVSNPFARDVIAAQQHRPGKGAIRQPGERLGGVSVEGAYIYPLPAEARG